MTAGRRHVEEARWLFKHVVAHEVKGASEHCFLLEVRALVRLPDDHCFEPD